MQNTTFRRDSLVPSVVKGVKMSGNLRRRKRAKNNTIRFTVLCQKKYNVRALI